MSTLFLELEDLPTTIEDMAGWPNVTDVVIRYGIWEKAYLFQLEITIKDVVYRRRVQWLLHEKVPRDRIVMALNSAKARMRIIEAFRLPSRR